MKKLNIIILLIVTLFTFNIGKVAAQNKVDIYFFYGDGCPHCAVEEELLEELTETYETVEVHYFETWYNKDNQETLATIEELSGVTISGVPFTVIGNKYYVGYSESSTRKLIEGRVKYNLENDFENPLGEFFKGSLKKFNLEQDEMITPTIKGIDLSKFSLPIVAIILGIVDGFNPCAMWVLLFLISMLISMKDRKRMWILGITFLTTSAIVYLFFMLAWLNFTSVIGSVVWLRILVGAIAVVGGVINLRSYLKSKDTDACDVVDDKKRKKIFGDIKHITHERSLILALVGIMLLAISVNVIELACSAGLPVVFTGILVVNDLTSFQYIMYVLLYILFFLIDDIVVFAIAMKTLEVTGVSTKFGKWSHLIGGILMIGIGILLFFRPEWLMFNF